jgi:hypothetical protein
MGRILNIALVAIAGLTLGACASNHMTPIPSERQTVSPANGKSLIHFMRPTSFGGAIQSTLYDGDDYIGTISANKRLAYQCDPGEHMFMIVGESADFMAADLIAGKTYYVNVQPRMGIGKARFSLNPMNGQVPQKKIDRWVQATREVEVNEKGEQWAIDHRDSIDNLKSRYLPKWEAKPVDQQQRLLPESGR